MSEKATLLRFPDQQLHPTPYDAADDSTAPTVVSFARRAATGILSHNELIHKLDTLGDTQRQAPLSFLVVAVHGLSQLEYSDWRRPSDIVDIMAHNVRSDVRVTDFVGRLGGSTIGVILQGANAERASVIVERLRTRLTRLSHTAPPIEITIGAASGHGINASVLPNAALSPLGESC